MQAARPRWRCFSPEPSERPEERDALKPGRSAGREVDRAREGLGALRGEPAGACRRSRGRDSGRAGRARGVAALAARGEQRARGEEGSARRDRSHGRGDAPRSPGQARPYCPGSTRAAGLSVAVYVVVRLHGAPDTFTLPLISLLVSTVPVRHHLQRDRARARAREQRHGAADQPSRRRSGRARA